MGFGRLKRNRSLVQFFLIKTAFLSLFYFEISFAQEQVAKVAVASLILRAKPSFLSKARGKLKHGNKVTVVKVRNDWSLVSSKTLRGWVLSSSLRTNQGGSNSILSGLGRKPATPSATYKDEIATVGKGLSPEYEKGMTQSGRKLNFDAVNTMESRGVGMEYLMKFKKEGRLNSDLFE